MRARALVPLKQGTRLLDVVDLADVCGLHPDTVRKLVRLGLVDPLTDRPLLFTYESAIRVRRIRRIRSSFGGTYQTAGLILELSERVAELERRLTALEESQWT